MTETIQKGIGAAFHVNAETRAFRDLFSSLKNAGINTVDPNDAHITIIDCAETQIPCFSERDQLSLNRARSKASEYLSTMPYYELVLSPEDNQLEVFGKRLGMVVAENEFLLSVRKYVGDIFSEEAGISLSNRNYSPHLSVGLKTRGIRSASRRIQKPKIPRNIHIIGHDVSERAFVHDSSRARSDSTYVNSRQRRLRSVS